MANEEQLARLKGSLLGEGWNEWRAENPGVRPDLAEALFVEDDLSFADLHGADLHGASLKAARLSHVNLNFADLTGADLAGVTLCGANLRGASLASANLRRADFSGADLSDADLTMTNAVEANFANAILTGCRIYGISAWGLKVQGATQQNLIITPQGEPKITVDSLEVGQFIYLLLHNQKIREAIDTITSKTVLILGRFTPERKAVLDALRSGLRERDYLPILFDFDVPASRDITETVSLLARMARFIIADLTDPSSIPKELEAIVPTLAVPVQPLLEGGVGRPYAMFRDYWKYDWVLPVHRYEGLEPLLATLAQAVIKPAEAKVRALEERRRTIEAQLTTPE